MYDLELVEEGFFKLSFLTIGWRHIFFFILTLLMFHNKNQCPLRTAVLWFVENNRIDLVGHISVTLLYIEYIIPCLYLICLYIYSSLSYSKVTCYICKNDRVMYNRLNTSYTLHRFAIMFYVLFVLFNFYRRTDEQKSEEMKRLIDIQKTHMYTTFHDRSPYSF